MLYNWVNCYEMTIYFTSVKRRVHLRGCGQEGLEADDLDRRPRLLGHREQRDMRRNPQG